MKKYCSLILTLCLAAALAGCGITTLPTPEDPEPPAAADPGGDHLRSDHRSP